MPSIQDDLNKFAFQPLAQLERLTEQVDISVGGHLPNKADPAGGHGEWLGWDVIIGRELLEFAPSSILNRGQAFQARLWVLCVDRLLQPLEFAFQGAQVRVPTLEQAWLEPAVEMLDAPIAVGSSRWDEHRLDAEAQAQADGAGEIAGRWPPADDFAGIVELHLQGAAQAFPALAQEVEDRLHLAGAVDSQANRTIEDVLADKDVVPLPLAFEINGAHAIHLMELIGFVGVGNGIGRS